MSFPRLEHKAIPEIACPSDIRIGGFVGIVSRWRKGCHKHYIIMILRPLRVLEVYIWRRRDLFFVFGIPDLYDINE